MHTLYRCALVSLMFLLQWDAASWAAAPVNECPATAAIDNVSVASIAKPRCRTSVTPFLPAALRPCLAFQPCAPIVPRASAPRASAQPASDMRGAASAGFLENRGQIVDTEGATRPDILYTASVQGACVYFRTHSVSTVFTRAVNGTAYEEALLPGGDALLPDGDAEDGPSAVAAFRVDMDLAGCNANPTVRAEGVLDGVSNYYLAHCPKGITGVRRYAKITYESIYDNIDLEYAHADGRLKYTFIVHPGGRVADIRMKYSGAESLAVTDDGRLRLRTPAGYSEEDSPYTYQEGGEVPSAFAVHGDEVSFHMGDYNASRTLIIDPWATMYGGDGNDRGNAIAIDGNGNVVISGQTVSANFPVTNASSRIGMYDAFTIRFSSSGAVVWATYIGGNSNDLGNGVAVDGNSNVIITGQTQSANFPVTNATPKAGMIDAFVVKFSGAGTVLWAIYCGGSADDIATAVDADGNGDIAITGRTSSPNFPVTNASVQVGTTFDVFVVKFNAAGNIMWATYIGGNGYDWAHGIVTDGIGNVVAAGSTTSVDFPVTSASSGTGNDGFIVKFSSIGTVQWSICFGGTAVDFPRGIAAVANGDVVVAGRTSSTNFPVTDASTNAGSDDAFVAKFNVNGAMLWATYYGGSHVDEAYGVAVDGSGDVTIVGVTESTTLPVTNASVFSGYFDAFVVKFSGSGAVRWATYLGGTGDDRGFGIAADAGGNVAATGYTKSVNFPVTNAIPYAGEEDVFVAHFDPNGTVPVSLLQFSARMTPIGDVELRWTTEAEQGSMCFDVERSEGMHGAWIAVGSVPGIGDADGVHDYCFVDALAPELRGGQLLRYRLRQVDFDGTFSWSPIVELCRDRAPGGMNLRAYPNPARDRVTVQFALPDDLPARIAVYTMAGREVLAVTGKSLLQRGEHAVTMNTSGLPSGTYVIEVAAGSARKATTLVLQ